MFWNGNTASDGLSGNGNGVLCARPRPMGCDRHAPAGDVLDLMLAQILEAEIDFVADLVAHDPADADPARLGQGFEPRRDIDAVA